MYGITSIHDTNIFVLFDFVYYHSLQKSVNVTYRPMTAVFFKIIDAKSIDKCCRYNAKSLNYFNILNAFSVLISS